MAKEDEAGEKTREDSSAVPKRVRRFSVFLILGVVALLAIGIWFVASWYGASYYGTDGSPTKPPPPAVENRSSNSMQ